MRLSQYLLAEGLIRAPISNILCQNGVEIGKSDFLGR